jgi:hypothetical protein
MNRLSGMATTSGTAVVNNVSYNAANQLLTMNSSFAETRTYNVSAELWHIARRFRRFDDCYGRHFRRFGQLGSSGRIDVPATNANSCPCGYTLLAAPPPAVLRTRHWLGRTHKPGRPGVPTT